MHLLRWLLIDLCHPRCAAMPISTGLSIPWCCPSMIYMVFICDDCHPLFPVVWSSVPYPNDRHGRTMIVCDAWRLTVYLFLVHSVNAVWSFVFVVAWLDEFRRSSIRIVTLPTFTSCNFARKKTRQGTKELVESPNSHRKSSSRRHPSDEIVSLPWGIDSRTQRPIKISPERRSCRSKAAHVIIDLR